MRKPSFSTLSAIHSYLINEGDPSELLIEFIEMAATYQVVDSFVDILQESCRDGGDCQLLSDRVVQLFNEYLVDQVEHHNRLATYHSLAYQLKTSGTPILLPDDLPTLAIK